MPESVVARLVCGPGQEPKRVAPRFVADNPGRRAARQHQLVFGLREE